MMPLFGKTTPDNSTHDINYIELVSELVSENIDNLKVIMRLKVHQIRMCKMFVMTFKTLQISVHAVCEWMLEIRHKLSQSAE